MVVPIALVYQTKLYGLPIKSFRGSTPSGLASVLAKSLSLGGPFAQIICKVEEATSFEAVGIKISSVTQIELLSKRTS